MLRLTPYWYTPQGQDDPQAPARFKLKPLTQSQVLELLDTCNMVGERLVPTNKTWVHAYKLSVIDFDNVLDREGGRLTYPIDLEAVPWVMQLQIGVEVYTKAQTLTGKTNEDEAAAVKN